MTRYNYLTTVLDEIEKYAPDQAALIVSIDRRMAEADAAECVHVAIALKGGWWDWISVAMLTRAILRRLKSISGGERRQGWVSFFISPSAAYRKHLERIHAESTEIEAARQTLSHHVDADKGAGRAVLKDVEALGKQNGKVTSVINPTTSTLDEIDTVTACLQPLRAFDGIINKISEVHLYVKLLALSALSWAAQTNLDQAIIDLLQKISHVYTFLVDDNTLLKIDLIRQPLREIAKLVSNDVSRALCDVSRALCDVNRVQQEIGDVLGRIHHMEDVVACIKEEISLDKLAYAEGVGLDITRICWENTRVSILSEITNWMQDTKSDTQHVFWLHGEAGKGKSAIAHTIAKWLRDVGGISSCFCFRRDQLADMHHLKIFATIARDLADRSADYRHILTKILKEDASLVHTSDIKQHWEKFIVDALSRIPVIHGRPVVVIIDALDESGNDASWMSILNVLGSALSSSLPPNIHILVTS
ncbi:hypothetical protein ID866_10130 [Astraeus odoratus]|nr:hypothetical protein ID866_10130 [Astraeus odoratus]